MFLYTYSDIATKYIAFRIVITSSFAIEGDYNQKLSPEYISIHKGFTSSGLDCTITLAYFIW